MNHSDQQTAAYAQAAYQRFSMNQAGAKKGSQSPGKKGNLQNMPQQI